MVTDACSCQNSKLITLKTLKYFSENFYTFAKEKNLRQILEQKNILEKEGLTRRQSDAGLWKATPPLQLWRGQAARLHPSKGTQLPDPPLL